MRVSLTEPPWEELPVGRFLRLLQNRKLKAAARRSPEAAIPPFEETTRDFCDVSKPSLVLLPLRHSKGLPSDALQKAPALHRDGSVVVTVSLADLQQPVRDIRRSLPAS